MKEVDWSLIHGEGEIVCNCDQCGNEYRYEFYDGYPDYKDCQETLKGMSWLSRRISDEWYDFCCEKCYYDWIKQNK